MDPDIHEIASFGEAYSRQIRAMHERARETLGLELPLHVFAARLLQAVELARGEAAAGDAATESLLDAIDAEDLYLATAAVKDDPEAREALRRWFGPFLEALGRPAGHEDLERELLERTPEGVPLEGYLGLGSLKQWILASAAQAAPPALPPLPDEGRGPVDPEARRALEAGPAAALGTAAPALRLALALNRLAGLPEARAAATVGLTPERFARECHRLEQATVRETRAAVAAHGLEPAETARALAETAEVLGAPTAALEALAGPLLAECAARALRNTPSASCPDANLLVGAIERLPGLDADPLFAHMARCWGCLQAATALGPRRGPVRRGERPRQRTAALVAVLTTAAVALVAGAVLLARAWPAGESAASDEVSESSLSEPARDNGQATPEPLLAVRTVDAAPPAASDEPGSPASPARPRETWQQQQQQQPQQPPRDAVERPRAPTADVPAVRLTGVSTPAPLRPQATASRAQNPVALARLEPGSSPTPSPGRPTLPAKEPSARGPHPGDARGPLPEEAGATRAPLLAAAAHSDPSTREAAEPEAPHSEVVSAKPETVAAKPEAVAAKPDVVATRRELVAARREAGAATTAAPPASSAPAATRPTTPDRAGEAERVAQSLRRAGGEGRGDRLVNLAVDRYRLGKERDAIDLLSRAIEVEPGMAIAHFDVALLYERTGERGQALRHWKHVLELTPQSDEAALARTRLGH